MTLLTLENLTASYGSSQALFGIDLTMAQGEVTALMGRNGMGKSCLLYTSPSPRDLSTSRMPSSA